MDVEEYKWVHEIYEGEGRNERKENGQWSKEWKEGEDMRRGREAE